MLCTSQPGSGQGRLSDVGSKETCRWAWLTRDDSASATRGACCVSISSVLMGMGGRGEEAQVAMSIHFLLRFFTLSLY